MENWYFNLGLSSEREKRVGKPAINAVNNNIEPTDNVTFDKWISVDNYDYVLLADLCKKFDLDEADLLSNDGLDLLNQMAERKGVFPITKLMI